MKAKFGAIVTDGRGKIGGHVASKNRSCAYFRTKVTPVNRNSAAQIEARARFTALSQAWRGLTAVQVSAWNAAVSGFATTNIFGDLRNPSGINLFQSLNNVLLSVGGTMILTPPAPDEVFHPVISSFSIKTTEKDITLSAVIPASSALKVYATAPMSAGISFVKSELRYIGCFEASSGPILHCLSEYSQKFGTQGAIGQKVFMEIEPVNAVTGQTGQIQQISAVIAA